MAKKIIENTIYLSDGSAIEHSNGGYYKPDLWLYVRGKTMMECMQIFSDPGKNSPITVYNYAIGYRYTGFNNLLLVQKSQTDDDVVDVRLTWVEGQPHSVEEIQPEEEEDNGFILPQ